MIKTITKRKMSDRWGRESILWLNPSAKKRSRWVRERGRKLTGWLKLWPKERRERRWKIIHRLIEEPREREEREWGRVSNGSLNCIPIERCKREGKEELLVYQMHPLKPFPTFKWVREEGRSLKEWKRGPKSR